MRREKKETDINLPPKKEIVIYAPITETQKKLYEATLNMQFDVLTNAEKVIWFLLIANKLYFN